MSPRRIAVCFEVTPKQTFASALDWPGWCRAGRDEGAALEALASYAERYTPVAEQAGLSVPSTVAFDVVERVPGGPATAFAAPECRRPFPQVTARAERAKVTPASQANTTSWTAAALAVTLGVAAACWVAAVREMTGMDMGTATRLGSFGFFIAVWAAMMLPGMAPAVLRRVQAGGGRAQCQRSPGRTWPSGHWPASRCTRCTGRTGPWPPAR